jgi:tetratricopeptide (TPR) repeat protein
MDEINEVRKRIDEAVRFRDSDQRREAANEFAQIIRQYSASKGPAVRERVAEALVNLGVMVRSSGDPTTAITIFDRVIVEYQASTAFLICALFNKGGALMALGRAPDAIGSYEELLSAADSYAGDDPAVPQCVAGALLNLGVLHARTGFPEKALSACDEALRRFASHVNPKLQATAANALHNKAMTLRNNHRDADAIAAMTELVERFGASSGEEARRWAGIAQYNKSIHLARIGDAQGSVAAAEEMVRRFGDSTDPPVRERLAKALYNRVLLARAAGRVKEAVHACWDIHARFRGDQSPVIQSVVAAARRYDCFIVALADPTFDAATGTVELDPAVRDALADAGDYVAGIANVIWDGDNSTGAPPKPLGLIEVLQILQSSPPSTAAQASDRESKDLEFKRKLLREQLQRDLEGHLRCGEILTDYLDKNEPFGIFLRNFDAEGSMRKGSGAPEPIRVSLQLTSQSAIEKKLVATLGAKLPLIGVGNNAPLRPDFQQLLPRLLLPNEHWQQVVEELIGAAAIVVVDVIRLTPGVLWELETIERLGKENDTVVILSPPRPEENAAKMVEELYGVNRPEYPPAKRDSPSLARFARFIQASELTDGIIDAPQFSDLIARIEQVQRLGPNERTPWDAIDF